MKKTKRWTAIVLVVLMCLPLCGCQMLDDMRATHAFLQDDGSVLWDGNVYRVLVLTDEMAEVDLIPDRKALNVTKADVPVLLSGLLGQEFNVYNNGVLLELYTWDSYERVLYCREDQYDAMTEALAKEFVLDTFYYEYYDSENGDYVRYYFSDEQFELVQKILSDELPLPMSDDFYVTMDEDDYTVYLSGCDADRFKTQEYMLEIVVTDAGYYLVTEDHAYIVPSVYKAEFGKMVELYYENIIKLYT